jgi:hypothetical protein
MACLIARLSSSFERSNASRSCRSSASVPVGEHARGHDVISKILKNPDGGLVPSSSPVVAVLTLAILYVQLWIINDYISTGIVESNPDRIVLIELSELH